MPRRSAAVSRGKGYASSIRTSSRVSQRGRGRTRGKETREPDERRRQISIAPPRHRGYGPDGYRAQSLMTRGASRIRGQFETLESHFPGKSRGTCLRPAGLRYPSLKAQSNLVDRIPPGSAARDTGRAMSQENVEIATRWYEPA